MNRIALVFFILFLNVVTMARAESESCEGTLTGRVTSKGGNPIEGAYVFIWDNAENQRILTGEFTDANGLFNISLPCGKYVMVISCLGYEPARYDVLTEEGKKAELGELSLLENTQELQTVMVKGSRMRVRTLPDGFSVNVSELAKSSNNALDLLGRLPQIRVKGNDLKVIGKDNIILRVNNVTQRVSAEELPNVLKGYDASLIKSVDVITSPAVKYDADGSTAMIILHMDSKFNKYVGGDIGTELMKGSGYNGRYGVYGSVVFNNNKLFVDVTPSYNHNFSQFHENTIHKYNDGKTYSSYNPSRGFNNYVGGYATLQYQYDKSGYLGVNCNVSTKSTNNSFISEEEYEIATFNHNKLDIHTPRVNASMYVEQSLSNSMRGWLELTYYNYRDNSDQKFEGSYDRNSNPFMEYSTEQKLRTNGLSFANDYSLSAGEERNFNVDFGLKGYYTRMNNSRDNAMREEGFDYWSQLDRLTLDETKINPYVSLTYRPNPILFFRLGAQVAYINRKVSSENIDRKSLNYTNFLPDFIASWSPRYDTKLSLIINSGSVEPKFNQINPFEWRGSQYTYYRGNLDLKSESRYFYRAIYTYRESLSVTAYAIHKRNQISSISQLIDGNLYYTTQNAQNSTEYGIRPSYYFDRLDWMELSVEAYWAYGISKGIVEGIRDRSTSNLWGGNLYAGFVFNKSRTFTGYINMDYTGRQRTTIATIDPRFDLGAGVSWALLDRKMNISLSGLNLFSSAYKGKSYRSGYTTYFNNRYDVPTLYLSITYKFNNVKDVSSRRQKSVRNVEQRM